MKDSRPKIKLNIAGKLNLQRASESVPKVKQGTLEDQLRGTISEFRLSRDFGDHTKKNSVVSHVSDFNQSVKCN